MNSVHWRARVSSGRARKGASPQGASEADEDEEVDVSLRSPAAIRSLQRELYAAAKAARVRAGTDAACGDVKRVGEPDPCKTHVRFDERGCETE
jgi:hypothetical protein